MKHKSFLSLVSTALALLVSVRVQAQGPGGRSGSRPVLNFNPDLSVIIDAIAYGYDGHGPLHHELEELRGFGHSHGSDCDHGHDHDHGFERGINLRHLELMFQAEIDPYFKGWAIVAVEEHGAEVLQGENGTAFEYHGDGPLPEKDGPRLFLG